MPNANAYNAIVTTVCEIPSAITNFIIVDSDDVQSAIISANETVTTSDGGKAIVGNGDDDTQYKLIIENNDDKSILVSNDGKTSSGGTDHNITDGGEKVNHAINIPANVKHKFPVRSTITQ